MKERFIAGPEKLITLDALTEWEFADNERKFTPESRYRYAVLVAEDGTKYFSKQLAGLEQGKDDKWAKYLERESAWADFAVAVGQLHPRLQFTGLQPVFIEKYDRGGVKRVVYPYVDADFVSEPRDSSPFRDPTIVARYASLLKTLDTAAGNWNAVIDNDDEHTPYDNVDKRWDEWVHVGELVERGYVTREMISDARKLVTDYAAFITPRFQHGDFVPWHVFSNDSDQYSPQWISFDGEHASMRKPRYYDLAYTYSRLFTKSRDRESAAHILGEFMRQGVAQGEFTSQDFYAGFLPVLMSRSVGMFLDARFDDDKGDEYFDEAKDLYERCISRDMRSLLLPS